MPESLPTVAGFYTQDRGGERTCRLCFAPDGQHQGHCPLVQLRQDVRELGAQLGLYVATMRELLDDVDALLRGDPERR